MIRGSVDGVAISLDAARQSLNDSRTVVTGSYNGSPIVLAFMVGALLYFT
jgi:hypothetical protein